MINQLVDKYLTINKNHFFCFVVFKELLFRFWLEEKFCRTPANDGLLLYGDWEISGNFYNTLIHGILKGSGAL